MEKELENSVSLDTGKLCTSCKQYNIFEKIERKIIRWVSNGIIGPGGSAYAETETIVTYFCEGCGQTFLPTKINKLDKDLVNHKEIVVRLLEETTSVLLKKNLLKHEIFEEIRISGRKTRYAQISNKEARLFKEGFSVQVIIETMGFQESFEHHNSWERDFDLNPYIVPIDSVKKFELVWWSKKTYQKVPLLKGEKREKMRSLKNQLADIKSKEKPKKSSSIKIINPLSDSIKNSIQQQIDRITADSETKSVQVLSNPLSKGSVMAKLVKVVDPKTASIRRFYIPKDSLK